MFVNNISTTDDKAKLDPYAYIYAIQVSSLLHRGIFPAKDNIVTMIFVILRPG